MIESSNKDYGYYWNYLKGNYKKGVYWLQYILTNPKSATDFVNNGEGVVIILAPITTDVEDVNSAELLSVLENSPYEDLAFTKWFDISFNGNHINLLQIAGDADFMAQIAASTPAMTMVTNAPDVLNIFVNNQASLNAILASNTAISAIETHASAPAVVAGSTFAMPIICESSVFPSLC
jgi:hypothetical protein